MSQPTQHLAQLNIGRLRYELDDPRLADFIDNLARVNAIAERSEGFVWRLQDETGNATNIRAFADPRMAVNISGWAPADHRGSSRTARCPAGARAERACVRLGRHRRRATVEDGALRLTDRRMNR